MSEIADYGYDAPYALVIFAVIGIAGVIGAVVAWRDGDRHLTAVMSLYAVFFLGQAISFYYTTRRGKVVVWNSILDGLQLRGDERVLDMGCGRGAVLIAVAKRLTSGRATGIDLWRTRDQSGNASDVTRRNARSRASWNVWRSKPATCVRCFRRRFFRSRPVESRHPQHSDASRSRQSRYGSVASAQTWRATADRRYPVPALYAKTLDALGAVTTTRRLGWRFWYGNPFAATSLVTASKSRPTA